MGLIILKQKQIFIIFYILLFSIFSLYSDSYNPVNVDTKEQIIVDSVYSYNETNLFYDSLKYKASKNWFTKGLHSLFIKDGNSFEKENNYLPDEVLIEDRRIFFNLFKGRIINNISIVKFNALDNGLENTALHTNSWIVNTANNFHIITKDFVIKNNLIFKKGDKLSPRILAENERIIRSLPYMKDCKIVIRPNFMYSDSIDIEIRTRDIWSLIVKGSLENSKKYNFGLSEYNFFGLGNQFQMSSYIDHDWEKRYAFKYNYDVENLFGSFISLHLDRKNLFDIEENRIKIERLFKSDIFHYGGGIEFVGQKNLRIIDTDIKPFKTELHDQLNIYDMWVGKVFSLKKNSLEYNEKKQDQTSSLNKIIDEDIEISNYFSSVNSKYNLLNEEKNQNIFDKNSSPKVTIATRLQIDDYRYRPDVSLDSNREFHSNSLFLSSISLSSNIFYKTRYIYGFGSTEDIPIGSIIELTAGKEFGEFTDRFYIGFEIAKAKFLLTPFAKDKKVHNLNYLYGNLTVGSFIDNYIFSQSIIKSKINFISRLFSLSNTFGLRNFVNLGYIIGFNRYPNEYLKTLVEDQNSNGLDNLDIESIKGSQKLSLTYESVFFTPWNLYGFKITPFIFSDIAVMNSIKESNNLLKSHKFFTGVGSGFRLKNERIIFETIQLSFTYHPNSYTGVDDFRFNLEIEYKLNFNPFIGGKPALISYE